MTKQSKALCLDQSVKIISTNPSRNYEVLGEVTSSTKEDVKEAISRAKAAQSAWAGLPLKERCEAIESFVAVSKIRAEEIAQLISKESGRPIVSARANVAGGIQYFTAYLEMAEKWLSPQVTLETKEEIHSVVREPWGVVACICPWNYPFMNIAWQCGQALIAGNTIVYKGSEEIPLFANLLSELLAQSRIPDGVFNIVYGNGQVGEWLAYADINMISFTGSTKTGRVLTKIAAEKFIPIIAELGGSSPGIIFDDSDINANVDYIAHLRLINCGQTCDAIKRLIVHEDIFDETVNKLCQAFADKKIGDALSEDTEVGPLISNKQLEKLEAQIQDAIKKGADVKIGGKRSTNLNGAYYMPTIVTKIKRDMLIWQEEVFGPVLPVVSFSEEKEAIALANDTPYGLSAHIFTTDKTRFNRVANQLESGSVVQNQVQYWHPSNPFGGYKQSGIGRMHGEFGFHDMTQIKLVSAELS